MIDNSPLSEKAITLRVAFLAQLKNPIHIDEFKAQYGEVTHEFMWQQFMEPLLNATSCTQKLKVVRKLNAFCNVFIDF